MKIQVQNLGPLQKAEFDLKPLTVLVGPNNSGKTWLAYLLSGIFGPYGFNEYVEKYVEQDLADYPPLDEAIEKVKQKGIATIDMHAFAEAYADTHFTNVAKLAQSWMGDFMATSPGHFSNLQVSVQLADSKEAFLQRVDQYPLNRNIARGLLTIRKKAHDRILHIYTTVEEESATDQLPGDIIRERIVRFTITILHRSLYSETYVFPTERTTFIAFPFKEEIIEVDDDSSQKKLQATFEERGAYHTSDFTPETSDDMRRGNAPLPIGNFLHTMVSIYKMDERSRNKRADDARRSLKIKRYIQFAELLETEILEGELHLATPEANFIREIEFHPLEDIKLGIFTASSMVKELAPLVLYLRYLAEPGDLLIIDEPELNLHPAAQVKIIEFLALLVDAGLHVLVTTHSTYVVDQLSNLMEASTYTNKKDFVKKFLLERVESFISPEKVAVYEVDNGELKNILDQDGSIKWQTFSEVSDLMHYIHVEMIREGEKEDGA
jgi:energy-coupling factor transporter ATP-binding protein EcfA2